MPVIGLTVVVDDVLLVDVVEEIVVVLIVTGIVVVVVDDGPIDVVVDEAIEVVVGTVVVAGRGSAGSGRRASRSG